MPRFLFASTIRSTHLFSSLMVSPFNRHTPDYVIKNFEASGFGIIMSSVGITIVMTALGYYAYLTSFANLVRLYIIPYSITNHWIVALVFVS